MSEKANLKATAAILKRAFIIVYQILPLVLIYPGLAFAAGFVRSVWVGIGTAFLGLFISMGVLGLIARKIWETPISLSSFFRDSWKYGLRMLAFTLCFVFAGMCFTVIVGGFLHKGVAGLTFARDAYFFILSPCVYLVPAILVHVRFRKIFKGIYIYIKTSLLHYPTITCLTFLWAYFTFGWYWLSRVLNLTKPEGSPHPLSLRGVLPALSLIISALLGNVLLAALIIVYKNTGQPLDEKSPLIQVPKDFTESHSRGTK